MAIDRTGISSLDTGASDITYSGNEGPKSPQQEQQMQMATLVQEYKDYVMSQEEAGRPSMPFEEWVRSIQSPMAYGGTARPTYTQDRKQRMAYGGIAGLDGRKKYGIGSWFQEKIMDPIKENPVVSALTGGALLNQFGIPFTQGDVGERMGQNWIGELLGNVPGVKGGTVNTVLGGGGGGQSIMDIFRPETISKNPVGGLDQLAKDIIKAGEKYDPEEDWKLGDFEKWGQTAQGNLTGTLKDYLTKQAATKATSMLKGQLPEAFPDSGETKLDAQGKYPINWKTPLAIGTAMGAAQAAMPKDVLPQDTSGINIADIRRRALTGSDPDLKFLPPAAATTAYAKGGRIGYDMGGLGVLEGAMAPMEPEWEKVKRDLNNIFQESGGLQGDGMNAVGAYVRDNNLNYEWLLQGDEIKVKEKENMSEPVNILDSMDGSNTININGLELLLDNKAKGGRIGAQEGGLMNLGGMEKDYRQEGGFVPLGGEERADDVPARLSKNEFVFTADAVRAAGGGDIDAGAEIMENLMKNLEQGGQVSEDSQGLEGARDMFATSQRLEGVL